MGGVTLLCIPQSGQTLTRLSEQRYCQTMRWKMNIDWAGAGGEDLPMAGDGEDIVEAFPEMEIDGPTMIPCRHPARPKDFHPKPSSTFGTAPTFIDNFSKDRHTNDRQNNLYYPFASADEWEVASYLARSNMTVVQIDEFLKLRLLLRLIKTV
ncbi:hypothetical protein B0H14DRAFT_2630709 [Mycena olivaceomarginata]|nr:hypothetical protein B0H14DRAFT_2630709 [Mycena olivaceomarginata]